MTLRRIHQNLTSLKTHHHNPVIPQLSQHQSILYDQEQPPHPKMLIESPVKWANSRIRADIDRVGVKTSTVRESKRKEQQRQSGNMTAMNTARRAKFDTIGPSNSNSPREKEQLFVPQRKKIIEQNKLAQMKITKNPRNTSFSSMHKKPLSPENNQQFPESKPKQLSQIKLINPNKTIHHISHLRKYQIQQKQRETLLNNRLKFITVGNEKDNKKLQMVKKKFEKVVSIRSTSLKQKQILSQTKSIIQNEQRQYKSSKINSIKQQQNTRRLSMSRLSQNKTLQASILRQQQKHIQRQILSSRLTQLQKKKQAVRHVQSSLQKSRERISELNRSRISSIRSIENKALVRNYMNVERREKINQRLHQTLQQEIKLINERKLKAASELKQYEELLGMKRNKSKQINLLVKSNKADGSIELPNKMGKGKARLQRAVSSTFSTSGSKSFYLTNY